MSGKQTTLVTGGTGFLGRHLIVRLVDAGEKVRVLTRSFDQELAELGVEIVEGSLSDTDDVRRAVEGVTRIYHLAGRVERDKSKAHLMYDLHVEGTRRLLDAARGIDDLEKIVVASTSGTVGVGRDPGFVADDDSPTAETVVRNWPYYLSKIYAERVCMRYVNEHDLPIVLMRPTLLLGPGDRRESSTGDVVLFLKQKVPTLMSGGLSFVDVRDVADAFIAAMDRGRVGETYLLGAMNCKLSEFFEMLEDLTGIKAPWIPLPDEAAVVSARLLSSALRLVGRSSELDPTTVEMATHFWYIDWSKAERELGFEPRDPVKTLRDTVRWIENNHADFSAEKRRVNSEFVSPETVAYAQELRDS